VLLCRLLVGTIKAFHAHGEMLDLVNNTLIATNFEKNLGIMGGLLMNAAHGSGIDSLGDRVYRLFSARQSPRD
jgi:uncharacterized membrane protein YphA (DoxX/SURF4 family)